MAYRPAVDATVQIVSVVHVPVLVCGRNTAGVAVICSSSRYRPNVPPFSNVMEQRESPVSAPSSAPDRLHPSSRLAGARPRSAGRDSGAVSHGRARGRLSEPDNRHCDHQRCDQQKRCDHQKHCHQQTLRSIRTAANRAIAERPHTAVARPKGRTPARFVLAPLRPAPFSGLRVEMMVGDSSDSDQGCPTSAGADCDPPTRAHSERRTDRLAPTVSALTTAT